MAVFDPDQLRLNTSHVRYSQKYILLDPVLVPLRHGLQLKGSSFQTAAKGKLSPNRRLFVRYYLYRRLPHMTERLH